MIAGPALAGQLLRVISAPVLVAGDAVSYLVSAAFVQRIRHRAVPPGRAARRPLRVEIAEGLAFVVRHRLLRRIAACTSISNLFSSMAGALFVLYLLQTLELDAGAVGIVFTAGAAGGLLGALTTSRLGRLVGEGRIIPVSILVGAAVGIGTPLAASVDGELARFVLLGASAVAFGASSVIYNVTQVSFRQRLCPPELLGRMNASIRFIVWGVMPIGAVLGGYLGAHLGIVATLWIAAAGEFVAAGPVLFSPLVRMRELPRELVDPT
jgi:MFS family permease